MHIAVLDTNTDNSDFGRSHPPEVDKFRALLQPVAPDWQFTGYKVSDGQFPVGFDGINGILITGSVASVNDPDPWVESLMDLIRAAHTGKVPVFGACFGHQAVAKALGGKVGYNPQGWVLGRYETLNHSPAPWMTDAPPVMALHAAHKEQVQVPPPGAKIHAGTEDVPHGHMSVGPRVFSTQYHPELSHDFMHGLLDVMADDLPPDVHDRSRSSLGGAVHDREMANWIKAFFEQARDA